MSDASAIILAAGLSTRMGAQNKLLLPFDGMPMVRRVVQACKAVTDGSVSVVLGHEADKVEQSLVDLPVTFIRNADFKKGQMTSVLAGLRMAKDANNYLIALGDQPRLNAGNLQELLNAHRQTCQSKVTIPVNGIIRGNPIIVPKSCILDILADPQNLGCRAYTRKNPERVHRFETHDHAFFNDVDTPEDLDREHEHFTFQMERSA